MAIDVRWRHSLFTHLRGRKLSKKVAGCFFDDGSLVLKTAKQGFIGAFCRLMESHFGTYPDFSDSFSTKFVNKDNKRAGAATLRPDPLSYL